MVKKDYFYPICRLLEWLGFGWETIKEWPPEYGDQYAILEQKNRFTGRLRTVGTLD